MGWLKFLGKYDTVKDRLTSLMLRVGDIDSVKIQKMRLGSNRAYVICPEAREKTLSKWLQNLPILDSPLTSPAVRTVVLRRRLGRG
jgi:hypothetical protein